MEERMPGKILSMQAVNTTANFFFLYFFAKIMHNEYYYSIPQFQVCLKLQSSSVDKEHPKRL